MTTARFAAALALAGAAHISTASAQSATTLKDAYRDAFKVGAAIRAGK